jgi:hypothetical protein
MRQHADGGDSADLGQTAKSAGAARQHAHQPAGCEAAEAATHVVELAQQAAKTARLSACLPGLTGLAAAEAGRKAAKKAAETTRLSALLTALTTLLAAKAGCEASEQATKATGLGLTGLFTLTLSTLSLLAAKTGGKSTKQTAQTSRLSLTTLLARLLGIGAAKQLFNQFRSIHNSSTNKFRQFPTGPRAPPTGSASPRLLHSNCDGSKDGGK